MQQAKLPQPTSAPIVTAAADAWFAAMATGDFASAWRASDIILAARPPGERDDPALPYHLRWVWDGTPVEGRAVLVRCYHGLGDTLQFCRYLPALRRRAAHVTLEVQPELIPLIALIGGIDRIVPFDPADPLPASGCDVEIMELAHVLRIAPQPVPYLNTVTPGLDPGTHTASRPPAAEVPGSNPRMTIGGMTAQPLRVGLCWHANAAWRPHRSMPVGALSVLPVEGVAWQSLQKGADRDGMAPCPTAVLDTARTVATLDLVITVDTMVAHLAGAVGTPTWLLLDTEPDWRWWAGSQGSVWYRGFRKYHQEHPGNWETPLRAVASDLTRCVGTGTVQV